MPNPLFRSIPPAELDGNPFRRFGEQWTLLTAEDSLGRPNPMTASWGAVGVLWGRPIAICFIRPERYTFGLAQRSDRLSFSFLPEQYREALRLCGTRSGRDTDKFAAAGLTPVRSDGGVFYVGEAEAALIGRKIYADDLKGSRFLDRSLLDRYYAGQGLHRVFVCEIEEVLIRVGEGEGSAPRP